MLITPVQLGTSATDITVSGASENRAVLSILFCNLDTVARVITLYAIPSGGSASATNTILSAYTIPAGDTFIWTADEKFILGPSEKLAGLCDVAAKVSVGGTYYNL
jgi:hypothetical protein